MSARSRLKYLKYMIAVKFVQMFLTLSARQMFPLVAWFIIPVNGGNNALAC